MMISLVEREVARATLFVHTTRMPVAAADQPVSLVAPATAMVDELQRLVRVKARRDESRVLHLVVPVVVRVTAVRGRRGDPREGTAMQARMADPGRDLGPATSAGQQRLRQSHPQAMKGSVVRAPVGSRSARADHGAHAVVVAGLRSTSLACE